MTDDAAPRSLEDRVSELETRLAALEATATPIVPSVSAEPATATAPTTAPTTATTTATTGAPAPWDFLVDSGEGWLGRAGVGLLVVGFILLFRYAVERGWLTPELRIFIGLVVGAGLFAGGVFYFVDRRLYRQILMGGGIVVLFITGLAAAELYHLISGSVALVFFAVVAGIAFTVAARQQEAIIASIAALGALLGPPFLLDGSDPGALLWVYLFVVVVWTGVLVSMRGWERTIVVTAAASVLALCHDVPATRSAQFAAILVVSACWLCYAALPLARARLLGPQAGPPLSSRLLLTVPVLVTLGLGFVADVFVLPDWRAFELSAALDAIGFAIIALWLRSSRSADLASEPVALRGEEFRIDGFSAAAFASVASLAAASAAGVEEPWQLVAVAAIAWAAISVAERIDAGLLRPLGHAINLILALAFLGATDALGARPAFDNQAVAYAIVAAIGVLVAFQLQRRDERVAYLVAVYLMVHVLLATELTDVKSAPWLASAAYGAVGSALLIWGLAKRQLSVQRAGMVSLALLVGRLFLYDLANVDVGVRIVLFMACGFAFLGLSYLVRSRRFAE